MGVFRPGRRAVHARRGTTLLSGDLRDDDSSDDVVVHDGNVVLQEYYAFPATDPNDRVGWVTDIELSPDESWMSYGKYLDPNRGHFLARNGALVARTGQQVPCGLNSAEYFRDAYHSETFYLIAGAQNGDYVYGGYTGKQEPNDPNGQQSVVMWQSYIEDPVMEPRPILRTGMLIDMNADGDLDPEDDPVILSFKDDSACLATDESQFSVLFIVVELELPSDEIGEALLRFRICPGDADDDGDADNDDLGIIMHGDNWHEYVPCGTRGDVTGNGYVDDANLDLWSFSNGCGQSP